MKILVFGAGVLGCLHAARLHEAGHDVALLARGDRLAALRRDGVRIAEGNATAVRRVPVPVVGRPDDAYDLTLVLVRAHQVDAVTESLRDVGGDVLFLLNWAAGAPPLRAALGPERVLLGFPVIGGGTLDGDLVRARPAGLAERLIRMPVGASAARLAPLARAFRAAGITARAEPRIDAWLATHAAFEVPLGQAALAAGGPAALADDPDAVRVLLRRLRESLAALPTPPVPRAFDAVRTLPEGLLVAVLRRFLRSSAAVHSGLSDTSPSAAAEYEHLAAQLRGYPAA
ncbi:ketopantoate reductase family protein [Cryptosporangium japonicum]|uniref:Ketopantoate reductase N-terminal domain-containing protein n=1 Tax=Cryptosporangium japonicum TaxID=80872 RepID=A0ABN0U6R1_9ACTN